MRRVIIIGAACFAFIVTSRVFSQELLTQATISGTVGGAFITNSLNLTLGFTPGHDDRPVSILFKDLWVHSGDIGHPFTLGPGDDPADFNLYTGYLTDGKVSYCCDSVNVGTTTGSLSGIPETQFFNYLPPGNNGVDLYGFTIDHYTLVFSTLTFASPGSNPNGNGNWTDSSYSATFSVYGEPVPEPRSLTLMFCAVVTLYCRFCHVQRAAALHFGCNRAPRDRRR